MLRVIISGINGRMGHALLDAIDESPDFEVVAGFDLNAGFVRGVPVFSAPEEGAAEVPAAEVIIDFSNYTFVPDVLRYAIATRTPIVLATTALGDEELAAVNEAAERVAVFRSANMSLGVNLVAKMSKLAAPVVEDSFNIEIIEAHHNRKKDAPSGTALLLADAINDSLAGRKEYIFGRHGREDDPGLSEIGIHAVRGGSIPGRHTVMFAGEGETIEITHTVYSNKVFATGALKAAAFLIGRPPGLYDMNSLIGS